MDNQRLIIARILFFRDGAGVFEPVNMGLRYGTPFVVFPEVDSCRSVVLLYPVIAAQKSTPVLFSCHNFYSHTNFTELI